jgi:hypothetical protein
LIQIKESFASAGEVSSMQWHRIDSAPFERDLELAVIDNDGLHALAFACRRIAGGWISTQTKQQIDVRPTHWREWGDD